MLTVRFLAATILLNLLFVPGLGFCSLQAQIFNNGKGKDSVRGHQRKSAPPDIQNWNITWYDDFDAATLDTSFWTAVFDTNPTNNSLHVYLPEQISVVDGNLVITSNNQPAWGQPYRSGQVSSKITQQYGRVEVRAKLPMSTGMWPAIWMLPDVHQFPWPSQGEIDLMENRGNEPFLTSSAFHWGTNPPFSHSFVWNPQQTRTSTGLTNYHDGFHVYAVEWERDQVRLYVDDVHHFSVSDANTGGFLSNQSAPMHLLINTAIGGDYLDNPDSTTVWPQQFLVDYVRVYERAADPYLQTFENGSFEENGGGMAHWTTFGNFLPNCTTDDEFTTDGSEALKLFGPFGGGTSYSGVEQGITVQAGQDLRATVDVLVPSSDTISGTSNSLDFKIDYYSRRNASFGSSDYLGSNTIKVANGFTPNDVWQTRELNVVAPTNAVEARVALVFIQQGNASGSVILDNVTFRVVPDPTPPLERKLLDGVVAGGRLSDLFESDNQYYELAPSPTGNPAKQKVDMILLSQTGIADPGAFGFRLEAAMSGGPQGDVIQTIELWNEQTGTWDLLDSRAATSSESTVEIGATGDLTRYINPLNGEVLAKVQWTSPSFGGSPFSWSIDVDQAVWLIGE